MTLSHEDVSELTRYFSEAGAQQRSIQGPILERAWLMQPPPPTVPREEITAWPTAEVRIEPHVEPDVGDFELFGRVSRKLRAISVLNRRAIEQFYGDPGRACAMTDSVHGSLGALHCLTKAGKALVKMRRELDAKSNSKIERSKSDMEAEQTALTIAEVMALKDAVELKERAESAYSALSEPTGRLRRVS